MASSRNSGAKPSYARRIELSLFMPAGASRQSSIQQPQDRATRLADIHSCMPFAMIVAYNPLSLMI